MPISAAIFTFVRSLAAFLRSIPKSAVVYNGPSMLTGEPIVAIVSGLRRASKNSKTGRMAQLWILCRDLSPVDAVNERRDVDICGNCKLRGTSLKDRVCYVLLRAPQAVWRAFRKGSVAIVGPSLIARYCSLETLPVRLGAYGDPAALPVSVLRDLTENAGWTGYTHQWQLPEAQPARAYLMASVDSPAEYAQAVRMGWRTFRTRLATDPLLPREIACPASDEMQHRTTCAKCRLCDGSRGAADRRANVGIIVHGPGKVHALTFLKAA